MQKPIIGVLGTQVEKPLVGQKVTMDYVNENYNKSIVRAGGIPFLIPVMENMEDVDALLALCDGLLFPGGADVDPKFYGEDPHAALGPVYERWDECWLHSLTYAKEHKLPMFGICRGLQLVNIGLGGSLYQDVGECKFTCLRHSQKQNRDYPLHCLTIEEGTLFHKLIGKDTVYTNTFHHQVVKKVGEGLKVTARTSDGVIEAMENADGSILLVQFHPEELQDSVPETRNLFKHLVDRALEFKNKR